mmetsp:Transcript_33085/g.56533  ORF Transcript_33085/g.56533 Transcript_33085/m.56533 type:complete len:201 (+) Transcript_33085:744-1346(+)
MSCGRRCDPLRPSTPTTYQTRGAVPSARAVAARSRARHWNSSVAKLARKYSSMDSFSHSVSGATCRPTDAYVSRSPPRVTPTHGEKESASTIVPTPGCSSSLAPERKEARNASAPELRLQATVFLTCAAVRLASKRLPTQKRSIIASVYSSTRPPASTYVARAASTAARRSGDNAPKNSPWPDSPVISSVISPACSSSLR